MDVRSRAGSSAICSGCDQPAPGYDQLPERGFEFIPFWGFLVFLRYRMRRVACRTCGVVVEAVPWSDGKHPLTRAYMLFLARWAAEQLSWKETAEAFHTSWDTVCHAVEYVVGWGLAHRTLAPIRAIGVDEIQYAKGHKYLTLVYQIDHGGHPPALGREGNAPWHPSRDSSLPHRSHAGVRDRVRLLGHVAALPGRDPPAVWAGAAYHPRSLPHRRQDEPGIG